MNDYGVAYYTLLPNGDLQGNWAHSGVTNVFTEVAIKTSGAHGIVGNYDFSYLENGTFVLGVLSVTAVQNVFTFIWSVGSEIWFEGIGLMISSDTIAVAYRDH